MSFLINDRDLERVSAPDGEWIDIRPYLTQEATDRVTNAMVEAKASLEGGNRSEAAVNLNLGKLAALKEYITAWSFTEGGNPLPVTTENINQLLPKYRTLVIERINRLTEESRQFSKKATAAST